MEEKKTENSELRILSPSNQYHAEINMFWGWRGWEPGEMGLWDGMGQKMIMEIVWNDRDNSHEYAIIATSF